MIEKQYGIIGKTLSHSHSPTLHNFWFKENNIKANYSLIEIERNQLGNIINKIRTKKLHGINVTVPYKQEIIPYLDLIINDAKATSSVNTVYLNNENKVVGENTDVYGFEQSFINKLNVKDLIAKNYFILGAGGVSPSLIYALQKKILKKYSLVIEQFKKLKIKKKLFLLSKSLHGKKLFQSQKKWMLLLTPPPWA